MPVILTTLRVATQAAFDEDVEVGRIAEALLTGLNVADVQAQLIRANQPGSSSHAVQAVINPVAESL